MSQVNLNVSLTKFYISALKGVIDLLQNADCKEVSCHLPAYLPVTYLQRGLMLMLRESQAASGAEVAVWE